MDRRVVLVVDDDRDVRDCVADALLASGYEVHLASDGAEALATLALVVSELRRFVVVTDFHMPRLNGGELAAAIRSEPRFANVRVLIVSSAPNLNAAAADCVMTKPFDLHEFRAVVSSFFDES